MSRTLNLYLSPSLPTATLVDLNGRWFAVNGYTKSPIPRPRNFAHLIQLDRATSLPIWLHVELLFDGAAA